MESLPQKLVSEFLTEYQSSGCYLSDRVAQLTQLAISDDPRTAESATRALFSKLIERLADSFEPDAVSVYNRAFAQLIQVCRADHRAEALDRELRGFGLFEEEDLTARVERLRSVSRLNATRNIQRVVVLSRVTLGADVAITSVITERIKGSFPAAEIVVVGGSKATQLFGGDPRVRFAEIGYHRAGTTIDRLLSWIDLLGCVRELTSGLTRDEYLIIDPDTRLTQLGLLPVGWPDRQPREQDPETQYRDYLFFPSREYGSGTSHSLSELTSTWLDEVLGDSVTTYPRVSLRAEDIGAARKLMTLINRGSRSVIAINFGVGENELKRVGGDFESLLVSRLIQEGAAIVLDKGAGEDEIGRADAVIADATRTQIEGRRVRAVEANEQRLTDAFGSEEYNADIIAWNGRIGVLAALIGESNLYIGYDSAGQHIAAALGVRCVDIFAGFSSRRILERWRPTGKSESRVVAVDTLGSSADVNHALEAVLGHANDLLESTG
jgi:ADP-heptose:LPS heptosyltransferase